MTSAMSFVSEASMVSVVSDIRKSTFFGGVDQGTGQAKLHFPFENVHLVPSGREFDLNSSVRVLDRLHRPTCAGFPLQLGHLYKVNIDPKQFEEYHRVAEDASMGWANDYGSDYALFSALDDDDNVRRCRCDCPNCATCAHKADSVLPMNYFCLAVEDNLYKRVVDEICASNQMPFGLFFCGHHEDVARPSICIPVFILLLLFGAMIYAAFLVQA